jgi:hypothetical protein
VPSAEMTWESARTSSKKPPVSQRGTALVFDEPDGARQVRDRPVRVGARDRPTAPWFPTSPQLIQRPLVRGDHRHRAHRDRRQCVPHPSRGQVGGCCGLPGAGHEPARSAEVPGGTTSPPDGCRSLAKNTHPYGCADGGRSRVRMQRVAPRTQDRPGVPPAQEPGALWYRAGVSSRPGSASGRAARRTHLGRVIAATAHARAVWAGRPVHNPAPPPTAAVGDGRPGPEVTVLGP